MNGAQPSYRFALFGLRRAGKSVFLAALHADRRPLSDGSTISYVDTEPPYLPGMTAEEARRRKERSMALYLENAASLGQGRVPAATEISEGVTRHRFNLTLPAAPAPGASKSIDIELLDYAGELLKTQSDETEMRDLLLRIVAETDGLLILAEVPPPGDALSTGHTSLQPLRELATAFKRLRETGPARESHCAALIVSKWDRIRPFDIAREPGESVSAFSSRLRAEEQRHSDEFKTWLGEAPEAGRLRELENGLRHSFPEADFDVWPTSALGMARLEPVEGTEGEHREIGARPVLQSLNLLEPIRFLIDRTRQHRRLSLEGATPEEEIRSADLPSDDAIKAEHGDNPALLDHIRSLRSAALAAETAAIGREKAAVRQRAKRNLRVAAALIASLVVIGLAGLYFAEQDHIADLRHAVEVAGKSEDLSVVMDAHDRILAAAEEDPWLGFKLPMDERQEYLTDLASRECDLWSRRVDQADLDIDVAAARQKVLPQCSRLDTALGNARAQRNKQDEEQQERSWEAEFQQTKDTVVSVANDDNCGSLAFNIEVLDSAYDRAMQSLVQAPSMIPKKRIDEWRQFLEKLKGDCLGKQRSAKLKKDHETAEARKLETSEWDAFLTVQKDFLDGASAADKADRLLLVASSLDRLEQKLRDVKENAGAVADPEVQKKKLETLIRDLDALKGRYGADLGDVIDRLRETAVLASDQIDSKAMCKAVGSVVDQYRRMQDSLKARDPDALKGFSASIEALKIWGATTSPLVREVTAVSEGSLAKILLKSVTIKGKPPKEFQLDRDVQARLTLQQDAIDFATTRSTEDQGFSFAKGVNRPLNLANDPTMVAFALKQDAYGWAMGSYYFAGSTSVGRRDAFLKLTDADDLEARLDLQIWTSADTDAESMDDANQGSAHARPGSDDWSAVDISLQLEAERLPDLKEAPACPGN